MRWTLGSVAAASVTAVAAVSGCVWAVVSSGLITPAGTTARACDLPTQPDRVPGERLSGPAVTALRGGAASHGFSVDGGLLSIEPPPPGAVPRVPRTLAECEALAAIGSDGGALDIAAEEWGLAIGYAMVTVSPGLPVNSSSWQSYGQAMPGAGLLPEPPGLGCRIPHPADRLLPGCCRNQPARNARPGASAAGVRRVLLRGIPPRRGHRR
jgi:hypothetical protein